MEQFKYYLIKIYFYIEFIHYKFNQIRFEKLLVKGNYLW